MCPIKVNNMDCFGDEAIEIFRKEVVSLDKEERDFFAKVLERELLREQDIPERYKYYAKCINILRRQEPS